MDLDSLGFDIPRERQLVVDILESVRLSPDHEAGCITDEELAAIEAEVHDRFDIVGRRAVEFRSAPPPPAARKPPTRRPSRRRGVGARGPRGVDPRGRASHARAESLRRWRLRDGGGASTDSQGMLKGFRHEGAPNTCPGGAAAAVTATDTPVFGA